MLLRFNHIMLIILVTSLFASCTTSKTTVFGKRSPHEKYADGLTSANLKQSVMGYNWFLAADKSLQQPRQVTIPYKESGYFAAETPSAAGYLFSARKGDKIVVNINTIPVSGFQIFAELWSRDATGKINLVDVADTINHRIQYAVEKDGQFIVRLQPELLRSVEYTVTITTAPSLAFPVDRSGDPKIISTWGVGRDNGTRSHEGIDIGARFRTPALAAANGYISRVSDNNLGGKVIFLNDVNTGYSLYYAHLDSQIARPGQRVNAGDVIGLVGKTGNAQNTVPHLHFGIYTNSGAIDPLAFVDTRRSEPKQVTASLQNLNQWMRTTTAAPIYEQPSAKTNLLSKTNIGDAVFVTAAADNFYKIDLPNGQQGFINSSVLTNKAIKTQKLVTETRLLDQPANGSPAKTTIAKGNSVDLIGSFGNFYLVKQNQQLGWILK